MDAVQGEGVGELIQKAGRIWRVDPENGVAIRLLVVNLDINRLQRRRGAGQYGKRDGDPLDELALRLLMPPRAEHP